MTAEATIFTLAGDRPFDQAWSTISAVSSGMSKEPSVQSSAENAAEFAWQHDDVFGRIANRYDILCDVFSLGIHRLWKRRVARKIASENWTTLLDGATGTGDIVLRMLSHEVTEGRTVIAADISPSMLAIAKRRLSARAGQVQFQQLDAEAMNTISDESVDAYSMSLVLKICNRRLALDEAFRVLRPGGRLIILEASSIPWKPLHLAYLAYMSLCMPVLGWLATGGDASAYRYLLQGVREFPNAEALATEIRTHGFEDVTFERLSLGIVAIHSARKPRST
jgi:demethylmenaquinone methyltransferase / 2-methoxy-6-polyprenyl-1,4-benzoquinol methylase